MDADLILRNIAHAQNPAVQEQTLQQLEPDLKERFEHFLSELSAALPLVNSLEYQQARDLPITNEMLAVVGYARTWFLEQPNPLQSCLAYPDTKTAAPQLIEDWVRLLPVIKKGLQSWRAVGAL